VRTSRIRLRFPHLDTSRALLEDVQKIRKELQDREDALIALLSALFTIPLVLVHPEMMDGGSPELRRNIFGKLKTGTLHTRLTR
jgi:hypothetical protein